MNMKRTMVLIPVDTHKKLRHLAVERDTSMGQMVREALEELLREDREDIARAESVLKTFKPGTGISYETYRSRRRLGRAKSG